ncbi:MAG: hypothetical protein MZW92_27805 [Comamonadaceae bacterium]|nr:hypothetical protein [Comamonadaceae bacterium]
MVRNDITSYLKAASVRVASLDEVRKNLKSLFKKDESSIERLFSGRKAILKRNADYQAVVELQAMFEDTGALCSIELNTDQSTPVHKDAEPDPREMETSEGQCNEPPNRFIPSYPWWG